MSPVPNQNSRQKKRGRKKWADKIKNYVIRTEDAAILSVCVSWTACRDRNIAIIYHPKNVDATEITARHKSQGEST